MISIAYVNGTSEPILSTDIFSKSINEIESIYESVVSSYNEYDESLKKFAFESSVNGFEDLELLEVMEKEGDGIITKIGNAIINIFKSFINFLKGFKKSFSEKGFGNKSDIEKIEVMIKKHPALKEKILANAKDLNLKDIQSLAELEKAMDEIMRMQNPKSIKEKVKKTKEKIADGVAIAAGTVTVAKAIQLFTDRHKDVENMVTSNMRNAQNNINSIQQEMDRLRRDYVNINNNRNNNSNSNNSNNNTSNTIDTSISNDEYNSRMDLLRSRLGAEKDLLTQAMDHYRNFQEEEQTILGRLRNMINGSRRHGSNYNITDSDITMARDLIGD